MAQFSVEQATRSRKFGGVKTGISWGFASPEQNNCDNATPVTGLSAKRCRNGYAISFVGRGACCALVVTVLSPKWL